MITHAIRAADNQDDLSSVRALFREYADALGVDLCFQGFEKELAELPGRYAPPSGCILLAHVDGDAAGCVAMRPLEGDVCEMKRLYVRPCYRKSGLGRALAEQIIQEGRRLGYRRMRLDTIPAKQGAAVLLYRSLGFEEVTAYCHNPVPGALFMELPLAPRAPAQW